MPVKRSLARPRSPDLRTDSRAKYFPTRRCGGNSSATNRTVIADPEGTELNRAWISYDRWNTTAKYGRQRIILDNARFAPSGGNRQPWFFVAVTDPERRAFIAEKYRSSFMRYIEPAQTAAALPSYPHVKRRNMNAAIYLAEHLHEVPVHLFVAGWTRRGQPQSQSLFPAVQNILLACRAVGLGASLTTQHRAFGAEIDEYLGLSEETPTCALLPIGWPLGKYGRPPRKPVDEVLFFNKIEGPDLNRKQRSG